MLCYFFFFKLVEAMQLLNCSKTQKSAPIILSLSKIRQAKKFSGVIFRRFLLLPVIWVVHLFWVALWLTTQIFPYIYTEIKVFEKL